MLATVNTEPRCEYCGRYGASKNNFADGTYALVCSRDMCFHRYLLEGVGIKAEIDQQVDREDR